MDLPAIKEGNLGLYAYGTLGIKFIIWSVGEMEVGYSFVNK